MVTPTCQRCPVNTSTVFHVNETSITCHAAVDFQPLVPQPEQEHVAVELLTGRANESVLLKAVTQQPARRHAPVAASVVDAHPQRPQRAHDDASTVQSTTRVTTLVLEGCADVVACVVG